MGFLHGVESIPKENGAKPIADVRTAVIGLVGIAPIGTSNKLTVITSERQGVETFGEQVPGFSIPQALAAIFAQGAGRVMVVNVLDSANHLTEEAEEAKTITNGAAKLTHAPVGAIVLTNNAGDTTFVAGTHYTVDAFGNIKVLDLTAITEGSTVKATYDRLDSSTLAASYFIGSASAPRKGFKLFAEAYATFGYWPKILICPKFCEVTGVAEEMYSQADAMRGVAIVDAPVATTVANAIAGRGASGTINGFKSSSKRAILTYPYVKAYDKATNANENRPFSQYLAGVMAANDNERGFWFSPSNREIKGITGVEQLLTAAINDESTETNSVNAAGITTIYSTFGTGYRAWGNRNASYPSNTASDSFIPVQRVRDILDESVEFAMIQFLDLPLNAALIDAVRASVNAYIRTLVQRGALVDGECTYDPANNPVTELAAGHVTFEISFAVPTAAERITFNSTIDANLLATLNEQLAN